MPPSYLENACTSRFRFTFLAKIVIFLQDYLALVDVPIVQLHPPLAGHRLQPSQDSTARATQCNNARSSLQQPDLQGRVAQRAHTCFETPSLQSIMRTSKNEKRHVEIFSHELHESHCGTHVRDIKHA